MARVVETLPAHRVEHTLPTTVSDTPPGVADELILVDPDVPFGWLSDITFVAARPA